MTSGDPFGIIGMPPARDQSAVVERFVGGGSSRLYVRAIGQGMPMIIVHGGPDFDHQYLLPDMDRLAESHRLVYYDQRGRGRSFAGPTPDVSMTTEIEDLDRIREHFGFETVAVLGHSWGGLIAMEYAVRQPRRVSHLVLMNTAPASHAGGLAVRMELRRRRPPAQTERMRALSAESRYQAGDVDADLEYYRLHFESGLRRREHLEHVLNRLRAEASNVGILAARAIERRLHGETLGSDSYDLVPSLRRLRIPTLIIHGDDDFIPIDVIRPIADAVSGSRLVVLGDCGHFAFLEQPERVAACIAEFLSAE